MKTPSGSHFIITYTIIAGMAILLAAATVAPSYAEENWKASFEEVCGKVQGADSMSEQEIKAMMDMADKLMPVIQASSDPGKKVFLIRLKRCRGVYEFMLDTKKK
jgi:hypothetical protein